MTMTEDNRLWQRMTFETCLQQVTSHRIQIYYLQSMKTTVYCRRGFVTPLMFRLFTFCSSGGGGGGEGRGNNLWPHSWKVSEKPITKDFQFSNLT